MKHGWTVHKFGGASLAGPWEFCRVAEILAENRAARQAVVVSASYGITDRLLRLLDTAIETPSSLPKQLQSLRSHHETLAAAVLSEQGARSYDRELSEDMATVASVLEAIRLLRSAPAEAASLVSGYGEVWSARLLAALLDERGIPSRWLHAGEVLTVQPAELGPVIDWETSAARLAERLPPDGDELLVITGYVARTPAGVPTTLGRNGSDFSASIFAALLEAETVSIWTDVDGVMSGDPRVVREAAVIPELSYNEAMELAYFGAKVIHPGTMAPLVERGIPLFIRNSFRPGSAGTCISPQGGEGNRVKGITTIDGMSLVNLEGAGMIGVPGTADRLFGALREAGISVVMISQGSSEHSICFAVPEAHGQRAKSIVRQAFALELEQGQIQGVEVQPGCSILAIVGDGMRGVPGVAATMFGSLGRAGVNVRAIAQGASERNISAVIDSEESARALRAVHSGFYLSPQTISVGVLGAGTVGSALLDQLSTEVDRLRREANVDIRVRGIATSARALTDDTRLALNDWREALQWDGAPLDLDAFVSHLHAEHLPHTVIIDCTASQEIADRYADWLAAGIHVVTPNKKASTASLEYHRAIDRARRAGGSRYLYETTVGAGLPILHTLRDLRETGDRIVSVEGVLSGTLAYLFNVFDGSQAFSDIVREARAKGYTEPDPRDDLSGMDVARKVVILGREAGLDLELKDVQVQSLVPELLQAGDVESFLDGLPAHDDTMKAMYRQAEATGEVLRYVGRLDADGNATVRLESLPSDHPFARINLTDNVVQFVTHRYSENPLIVRGPGAGPAVTAAGVFADLLRLCTVLGANI
jgi:aspartokinase/homoserine dehydrogenase 1